MAQKNTTIILGLTGGIGMGKSTVATLCRDRGIPVFDSDRYIHRSLNKNGAGVQAVRAAFPSSYDPVHQKINRALLGQIVFKTVRARQKLEKILHPMVRAAEIRFIARHQRLGTRLIILDIPLMFETQADRLCTAVMVVSAPASVQRTRVLSRPHMTLEKFTAIKKAQMPHAQRLARADYILDTSGTPDITAQDLERLLNRCKRDEI